MIAIGVYVQGEFMILISGSYSGLLEFRLSSRSAMFYFICRVAGLRESQSQSETC